MAFTSGSCDVLVNRLLTVSVHKTVFVSVFFVSPLQKLKAFDVLYISQNISTFICEYSTGFSDKFSFT